MIYQNTAGIGLLGIFMKFSRSAEEEADKLGVQYMYAAGYDPGAMATMFEKAGSQEQEEARIHFASVCDSPGATGSTSRRIGTRSSIPRTRRIRD